MFTGVRMEAVSPDPVEIDGLIPALQRAREGSGDAVEIRGRRES